MGFEKYVSKNIAQTVILELESLLIAFRKTIVYNKVSYLQMKYYFCLLIADEIFRTMEETKWRKQVQVI